MCMNRIVAAFGAARWKSVSKERAACDRGSRGPSSCTTARNERRFGMKRYMNHTTTIGMLAILIGVGTGAPEAFAGVGVCTICRECTDGVTACFPGGTPLSVCTDLGCVQNSDTSAECAGHLSCPDTEAGQCDDGVNNDAYQNGDTDCDDAACAGDPACIPTGACCNSGAGTPQCDERFTESECNAQASGVYMGDGSTCCDGCATFSNGGACCGGGAGAGCFVSDEAGCAAGKGGIFHGVGTTCDPVDTCPAEPTFCQGDVPTVSEWGLVCMTLLLLVCGTCVLGRRQSLAGR